MTQNTLHFYVKSHKIIWKKKQQPRNSLNIVFTMLFKHFYLFISSNINVMFLNWFQGMCGVVFNWLKDVMFSLVQMNVGIRLAPEAKNLNVWGVWGCSPSRVFMLAAPPHGVSMGVKAPPPPSRKIETDIPSLFFNPDLFFIRQWLSNAFRHRDA